MPATRGQKDKKPAARRARARASAIGLMLLTVMVVVSAEIVLHAIATVNEKVVVGVVEA